MLVLFTDFGLDGPYVGQVKAVLHREAPGVAVVDLFADAPAWDPRAAAYLLAAYVEAFPAGSVFLCVVDPGVGTARAPVVLRAGGRWYVGPDNGLMEIVLRRAGAGRGWRIDPAGRRLSATFHGRDLFAPVAAAIARGLSPEAAGCTAAALSRHGDWPDDLAEVIYVDRFGNLITGLRAATVDRAARLAVAGRILAYAPTFAAVAEGGGFWYDNANGLVEIAANRARADRIIGARVGTRVEMISG